MNVRSLVPFAAGLLVLMAALGGTANSAANLTVDGNVRYQAITGMGVNINVNSWKNGELRPALDWMVNPPGATNAAPVFRVIRDPIAWVTNEADIAPLHALDPATLTRIYETPFMQDLWNTIAYLNTKGVRGPQIVLNFMGWTPTWMGGSGAFNVASHITAGKEASFATMVASLVYYARVVKGLDFTSLAPMNEEDWNCLEGPCVGTTQYTTVLHALAVELTAMGQSDIRLVGPDPANASLVASYITPMLADATVSGRVDHLGLHIYGAAASAGSPHAGKDYWLTETAAVCSACDLGGAPSQGEYTFSSQTAEGILGSLQNGIAGVLIWDGYDSFYYHHNAVGTYGLLAYNASTGIYTPRKRYFVDAQIYGFISPGAFRISETDAISALGVVPAFFDVTSGRVTLMGQNLTGTATTINGQLNNLPTTSAFSLYTTNSGSANLLKGADVAVTSGAFSVTIPGNTFFTLVSGRDTIPPVISAISGTPTTDTTATIVWSTNEAANSRVDYGIAADALTLSKSAAPLLMSHTVGLTGLPPGTTVYYRVTSSDAASVSSTAPAQPLSFTTPGGTTGVSDPGSLALTLSRAFPNPTQTGASFVLTLPAESDVRMSVLDIAGREVWGAPPQRHPAGRLSLAWDGSAGAGAAHPGMYFARIRVGSKLFLRPIAVIR